jgi:hypothetical protein
MASLRKTTVLIAQIPQPIGCAQSWPCSPCARRRTRAQAIDAVRSEAQQWKQLISERNIQLAR